MTSQVPEPSRAWVLNPPVPVESLPLPGVTDEMGQPRGVGRGFAVERTLTATRADGRTQRGTERWLVTGREALARRHPKTLLEHWDKAEAELTALNPKESAPLAEVQAQAERVLRRRAVTERITLPGQETVTVQPR
jgi:hypothetical protein